jgi:hypothetical protein
MTARQTYLRLLNEYLNVSPRTTGSFDELSDELDRAERQMLDNPPPGVNPGLLDESPLGHQIVPRGIPVFSDEFETVPEIDWPEMIAAKDSPRLRPFVSHMLDQESDGSCASEGLAGSIMCRRSMAALPKLLLNPLAVYGRVNGGQNRGSTLADNLRWMEQYGVPSEAAWPRSKGWRAEPSEEAREDAMRHRVLKYLRIRNKEEFGTCLVKGLGPVYFGYPGHAIWGCDAIDRRRFRFTNSWGAGWSDGGFGTISYDSIYWGYGVYLILSVTTPEGEV